MSSSPHEGEPRYGRRTEQPHNGPGDQQPGEGPVENPYGTPASGGPAPTHTGAGHPGIGQDPYGRPADSAPSAPEGGLPSGAGDYGQPGPQPGPGLGAQGAYGPGPQGGPYDYSAPGSYSGPYGPPGGGGSYGAPGGQPGHYGGGASPSGWDPRGSAPAEAPKRPGTLLTSLFLTIGAGLTVMIAGIIAFSWLSGTTQEELLSEPDSLGYAFWDGFFGEVGPQEGEQALLGLAVMLLLAAGFGLVVYLVLAFVSVFAGNPGRIIGTVALALAIMTNLFALLPYGMWMLLASVLALAGLILLWLPPSNQYYRRRRAHKQSTLRGYGAAEGGPGYGPSPYG